MSTKTMKFALAAVLAAGVMSAQADEDPFAEALAQVVTKDVVAPAVKQIAKMPEAKIKQAEDMARAKNVTPTATEMKEDKGVQTVAQMQKAAPKETPPVQLKPSAKSAKEIVEDILKKNGIKTCAAKDCIIQVAQVKMPMSKPAEVKDFFVARDLLGKLLVLQMKGAIAAKAGQVFSAKELANFFDDGTNATIAVSTESEAVARLPLFGVTMIAQAEAWDGKEYQIAGAAVWSQVLHRAAKATLLGEPLKAELGDESLDDWLDSHDLSLMCGPRQMIDKDGTRVYLGIAARETGINPVKDQLNEKKAQASAMSALVLSLFADVEQRLSTGAALEMDAKKGAEASEKLSMSLTQSVKDRVVEGASEIKSVETVHPLTGKKMYVSVCSLDAESAANARVMAEELFATRVLTELANKRSLGRLQGYLNAVEKAKQNTSEYYKGMEEGEKSVNSLVQKHTMVEWKPSTDPNKSPAEVHGIVTGESVIKRHW